MRVHELAKELNINSKELLEFLSSKNEKIKTSSNSVSEDEIALAKSSLSRKNRSRLQKISLNLKRLRKSKKLKNRLKNRLKMNQHRLLSRTHLSRKQSFPYITHKTADGRISGIHSVKIITGTETVMVPMTIEEMKNLLTGHRESVL